MLRPSRGREWFVIDAQPGAKAGVLQATLRMVEQRVHVFECDLPLRESTPAAAREAQGTLLRVARHPRRSPPATGLLSKDDPEVWDAFVAFAPFAYDGSVWAASGGSPIVAFNDEGQALAVCLDADMPEALAALITPAVLVPSKEWRRRRKAARR